MENYLNNSEARDLAISCLSAEDIEDFAAREPSKALRLLYNKLSDETFEKCALKSPIIILNTLTSNAFKSTSTADRVTDDILQKCVRLEPFEAMKAIEKQRDLLDRIDPETLDECALNQPSMAMGVPGVAERLSPDVKKECALRFLNLL